MGMIVENNEMIKEQTEKIKSNGKGDKKEIDNFSGLPGVAIKKKG